MKTITLEQAKNTRFKNLSVALGTFDGLHIGHMKLIESLLSCGGESAVFTFGNLPSDLFVADRKPMMLFTPEEKSAAFAKTGVGYLCATPFDRGFARLGKAEFESLLVECFSPVNIIAGYNYTYGRHARGNADTLEEFGERRGIKVRIIPPVVLDGEPVSSTRIRECLEAGSVEKANMLLGYEYALTGTVEKGEGLGRLLGFPTANLRVPAEKVIPLRGVYEVESKVDGKSYKGLCNIGTRPTVSAGIWQAIEVHLLSLSGDLYGRKVTVLFKKRLRDEMKFSGAGKLVEQIKKDIERIRP